MIILMQIDVLWPFHFSGRSREYVHVEKLCNLDKLVHSNLPKLQKNQIPKIPTLIIRPRKEIKKWTNKPFFTAIE